MLNEISTSRLLKHLSDNKTLAIISTYRTERTEKENLKLLKELKHTVIKMKLGFTEFIARWVETDDDGNSDSSDERSLMIYGITLDQAIELGKQYDQSSIIFKFAEKCAEVCTVPFTDYEGKKHEEGSIVRVFNTHSDKPLNIEQAKAIFNKKLGGPASMPVKGNRPFNLQEVLEVEPPNAKTFSVKERYIRLI